jgi:CDP-diacylglycerol--glycerol-3-phosphate 3-phosphatidyltransferase
MTLIPTPVRRGFEAALEPLVRSLISGRVSPNAITTVGTLILLGGAAAYGAGAVRLGGFLLLLSGAFDVLDGKVARSGGRMTRFGAFYDSTLDRVGEAALFTGIAFFFLRGGVPADRAAGAVVTAMVALGSGLIVSYTRARAEGLGMDCRVGVAQRAERIVGLGAPTLFFGAGPDGWLLLIIVALLALTAVVTVGQRIAHIYRTTRGNDELAPSPGGAVPGHAGKGQSGR